MVCVHVPDLTLLDWIAERLPRARGAQSPLAEFRLLQDTDSWVLEEDGRSYVHRGTRSDVAVRLLERLNELVCFTNPSLTVHSGLVVDDAGRGLWIPAASGAGKSTLTAQLALSGLRYATDEATAVSAGGTLTGWPKWLGVKPGSQETLRVLAPARGSRIGRSRQWMVPPHAVGTTVGTPVIARIVVLPARQEEGSTRIEVVSRAHTVSAIAPHAFNLQRLGRRGIETLASAVRHSHACVRVAYADGWDASERLIELLDSAPAVD